MNTRNYKQIQKYCNEVQKFKVSCECGHRVFIPFNRDFKICTWCGRKVYKNDIIEFKHVLKDKLHKNNKILIKDNKVS